MLQLQKPKGGIDFAHLAVDAGCHDGHLIHETEVLQMVDALLGFRIRTDDRAALKRVEDLGGVETDDRQIAMLEHAAIFGLHTERVRGVVDDLEVVVIGDLLDGFYIAGMAIAVHRHDRGRLRRDSRFDLLRIEIERVRIDIHEDRLDAVPEERVRGRCKRIGRRNHFAVDAQGLQRSDEGQRAVRE